MVKFSGNQLLGRFYGFPLCCILDFGKSFPKEDFPLIGTGYVPCERCQTKTEEELIAILTSRRKCPTPFPYTEGDDKFYNYLARNGVLDRLLEEDVINAVSLDTRSFEDLDKFLDAVVQARNKAWEKLDNPTIPRPLDGWNCFHCGMKFHHVHQARLHFGPTPKSTPYCQFPPESRELIVKIRKLENELETTREVFAEHLEECRHE